MLEFHEDFIRLDERPKYAVRYNILDDAGMQTGPFLFHPWPKNHVGAVSESEPVKNFVSFCSHGFFAVPLEKQKKAHDVVNDIIREGEHHGKEIVLMLVQYYESDVISSSEEYFTEIVLRQGNIIKQIKGKDFFRFLEKDGDIFIKDFESRQKREPFKSYAKKVEDWSKDFEKFKLIIRNDRSAFLNTLLFLSNFIGQFTKRADLKIIAFFPFFMVIMEDWKKKYHSIYKDYVSDFIRLFKRNFMFEDFQIEGLTECVICSLEGSRSDVLECNVCQDAYTCAVHIADEHISREKLNLEISYMIFNGKYAKVWKSYLNDK